MAQPAFDREGYGIFVRCCGLAPDSSTGEFVTSIEALDAILLQQIQDKQEDFFPNPYGGAIYRPDVSEALGAARALVSGLGEKGVPAAIGIAWGRFRRTVNVHAWNAAALPLNEAARLAFCTEAVGRVFVSPHVRKVVGSRVQFSEEGACHGKDKDYPYYASKAASYEQRLSAPLVPTEVDPCAKNVVLWDIVKYSTKDPDEQAVLSHDLALNATIALDLFRAMRGDYSPAGDGGFAAFDTGLQAIEFAKTIQRRTAVQNRTGL
jgi:hypothetical protein